MLCSCAAQIAGNGIRRLRFASPISNSAAVCSMRARSSLPFHFKFFFLFFLVFLPSFPKNENRKFQRNFCRQLAYSACYPLHCARKFRAMGTLRTQDNVHNVHNVYIVYAGPAHY